MCQIVCSRMGKGKSSMGQREIWITENGRGRRRIRRFVSPTFFTTKSRPLDN